MGGGGWGRVLRLGGLKYNNFQGFTLETGFKGWD